MPAPWLRLLDTPAAHVGAECLFGLLLMVALLSRRTRFHETHRRGARVEDGKRAQRLAARLKRRNAAAVLTLAGVRIAPKEETLHFKLIGATGTGKSTAIHELLAAALGRGDRAVIADPHGGYRARCFDGRRGDVILNPFERASAKWDPFAELGAAGDAEQLAASLIPRSDDASGREWRGYARTFLTAVLRRCPEAEVSELFRLIAVASGAELRPIVEGTPAQPFLEPENARMFGSIRSVAVSAVAALEHVCAQRARPFSVRRWVREGRGVLFLPYQAGQVAALSTIIAAWIRLAVFEAMHGEQADQRLWFIVDEFDALGAIDGLKDALARLRKFGGRCVLGFQSIAQVSATYGAGEAQTIVENCSNTLILRSSASEHGGTSQFCSRLIGERQVMRRAISTGRDSGGWGGAARGSRRSRQISEQVVTEAAVLPSEIEQLPDLAGYLKTASSAQWLKVRLRCAG